MEWVAAVSPIAVLLAVWRGWRLNRLSEHEAWLRNQRMSTYARMLGALHEALAYAVNDMWFNADPHRHSELCKHWGELRAEMERLESEVTLVGPADVTEAAQRAVFAMEAIGYLVRDWEAIRGVQTQTNDLRETTFGKTAADAEQTFVKIAAKAVGNPPPRRPPSPSAPPRMPAQFVPDWPPAEGPTQAAGLDDSNEDGQP